MTYRNESLWAEPRTAQLEQSLREFLEVILLTLILFFTLRAVLINFRISGTSMLPTLRDGEYVFVYRLAYWRHPPHRGDIIVFRYPLNPKRTLIKRVIGLPGETVSVHNGQVYINGQLKQDMIVGRAVFRFWPLHRIGLIPHPAYPPPFDE